MQVIIDRFEGNFAVVELPTGTFVDLPKELVPDAQEGDIIDITINHQATEAQAERIQKLMDELFED